MRWRKNEDNELLLMSYRKLFFALGLIALCSLGVASFYHAPALAVSDPQLTHDILVQLRIPHVLTAFVTGGLLALAGALMQVLVRNPLADPYLLGVSGGAGLFTLLLMLCGLSGLWLTAGAWAGSLITMLLIFLLTRRQPFQPAPSFLLTGVALASGFSALVSLILLISPDPVLRGMLFWLIGDLSYAHLPVVEGCILLIGLALGLSVANELNLLVRGDKTATSLGVNTPQLQWKLYLLSSLLTATAVTLAGCIGFVGLIIPHFFRLLFGYDHRYLLPGSVFIGGTVLTLADLFARNLIFPQEIPVGIVMVLMGIPVFLYLLPKSAA